MKTILALAGAIALLCTFALAQDGNKKDEKKADPQPKLLKVTLTPAQNKALEEIEQQFQRLQEEAQKQAQILSARESGLITAFVMGTKLEGKQYKLVKEKDGYLVEEVIPPAPEPPATAPGAVDKNAAGQSNPTASPAQPSAPPSARKDKS
jgi:hypothetical protein